MIRTVVIRTDPYITASHGFDALATCALGFEAGYLNVTVMQDSAVADYDVFQ